MANVWAQREHRPISSESTGSAATSSVDSCTATAELIRAQLPRRKGTLTTFEDKMVILRLYSNYILDGCCTTHTAVCNRAGSDLQNESEKSKPNHKGI